MQNELRELLTVATTGAGVVEGVKISHVDWLEVLYLTPVYPGFTAQHEDGQNYTYQYVPMRVVKATKQNDLSQDFSFTIQDLNELVGAQLDRIPIASTVTPSVELRSFVMRDDGTTSGVQDGPYLLEARDITSTPEGSTFTAAPPQTNYSGTGEIYTFERFPSLLAYTS